MVPSPGPCPNQPPRAKDFRRHVDLECVARRRIHEALDAPRYVRHEQIGAEQPADGRAGEADDPDHAHAGHEEQRAPHHQDQHGLAEVRLEHQQGHHQQQRAERHRRRRHLRTPRRFREQPRDQHDEGGFCELRRLDADAGNGDPAARALDLRAEHQGCGQQHHADAEHDQRRAPHLSRRHERDADHHGERRQDEHHVPVEEVERIEPDTGRQPADWPPATG